MISQTDKEAGRISVAGENVRAYEPKMLAPGAQESQQAVFGAIPAGVFANHQDFIAISRKGIPGIWVKWIVEATGMRAPFLSILNVSSSNLSRVYNKETLSKETSEEVLDAVRLLKRAIDVWESSEMANQWLNSEVVALGNERPINLLDTFEGRRWVFQVLNKIEHGDFS